MERRGFLSLGALAIAGCLGDNGDVSFEDHPATTGIEDAPSIGDEDSDRRIVAFEDPSCPTCAEFSRETFPRLAEDARAGELVIYSRPVPFIADWSGTACAALHTTYDRDPDSFWTLFEGYYGEQSGLSTANIEDRTRALLGDTPVDGDEVIGEVGDGVHRETVQTSAGAAEESGMSLTPTFYLFDSDGFVTDASGSAATTRFRRRSTYEASDDGRRLAIRRRGSR